jgi:hypothetical protein
VLEQVFPAIENLSASVPVIVGVPRVARAFPVFVKPTVEVVAVETLPKARVGVGLLVRIGAPPVAQPDPKTLQALSPVPIHVRRPLEEQASPFPAVRAVPLYLITSEADAGVNVTVPLDNSKPIIPKKLEATVGKP